MNALVYVIAVLNPLLMNTKDVEVRVGPLHSLIDDIRALDLPPDAFKYNSYYRSGHKGVYISNNLRDFIYYGKGDQYEEGSILILDFQSTKLDRPNQPDPLAFLLHPYDFSDADKVKVDKYIQTIHRSRNMRSIHKQIS